MSLDAVSFERTFGMGNTFSPLPTTSHQLRFKAAVLNEKVKRSMDKVIQARKIAETAEIVHQIKTNKALQIVFKATEIAYGSGEHFASSREFLSIISDIRKQQYVEAALAAMEAADAQHIADAYESVSTKLLAAAKIIEDLAQKIDTGSDADSTDKMALADSLIVAVANEESNLSMPNPNEIDIDVVLQRKEQELEVAIQRVKASIRMSK